MIQTLWRHFCGIGLILVVAGGFYLLLRPFSPRAVDSHIYAIKFITEPYSKQYQIQGNTLDCQPQATPLTVRCSTLFEGQMLEVYVHFQNEVQRFAQSCRASYAGQVIGCKTAYDYENPASSVLIRDDLGVSAARFAELRRQNRWLYWDEEWWLTAVRLLTLGVAMGTAVWHHRHNRQVHHRASTPTTRLLASVAIGLLTYTPLYLGIGMTLGYTVPWAIPLLALLGTALVIGWHWFTLSGWQPGTAVRLAVSFGYGLVLFLALNFLLVGDLLRLGFVD